ncbi:uncharacterized protein DS421_5g149270 [Arachis hypogaea]|nr:uncharacterized protein DS421_5g149270 [Arachis hypogaea]
MVPARRGHCQCFRRAMASGDAHVPHAVRRVHQIEWHQIDRVLPQFGGVQPIPHPALNIDFLMSKDGRGGDRWFPSTLQRWHLLWDSRQDSVLRFDVVGDPGPSHAFLDWWRQYGKRFLSPEPQLGDPRAVPIP